MSETTKKLTVRDVYEALDKDGFEHLRGKWYAEDVEGAIVGGCVLQQTAINLGVITVQDDYEDTIYSTENEEEFAHRFSLVRQLNKFKVPTTSKWSKNEYGDRLYERGIADVLIYWNDVTELNRDTGLREFALRTYEDVSKMAKEIMEPFFDKEVTLKSHEWTFKRLELVPA